METASAHTLREVFTTSYKIDLNEENKLTNMEAALREGRDQATCPSY